MRDRASAGAAGERASLRPRLGTWLSGAEHLAGRRRSGHDAPSPDGPAAGANAARPWPGWLAASRGLRPERTGPRLLSLILAAAIPVLFFGGWVAYILADQDRIAARQAAAATVQHVAERVASEIATQLEVAAALAASTALDRPDLLAFYTEAQRLKTTRPRWHTIELTDPAGTQVLNLLRPLDTPLGPTADRDSFERVVRTHRPAVGGIGPVGTISGRQLVALRVPVLRDGRLRYVLSVALAPEGVSAILHDAGAPEGWIGVVADAQGRIIARTIAEAREQGRPASPAVHQALARAPAGFYRGPTLEGIEVDTFYRTLPHTAGWSVHFGIPSEKLDAPVRRSVYLMVGGGLVSLALAAGLAAWTARDLAQRRREEQARSALVLQVSEERGAVAVEAADLGTWQWDIQRGEVVGSRRCWALLGRPRASADDTGTAWRPRAVLRAVHPDDRTTLLQAIGRCLRADVPLDLEFRFLWPDGSTRWVRATGRAQRRGSGSPALLHGVIADVEPRRRARAERIHLLRRLAQGQEDERRRIARELHDQVGQTVTGLSLGLKGLERTLEGERLPVAIHDQLRWLQGLTTAIGHDIHRAASDLRPTALDDLGLHKALIACASAWSERSAVAIDVQFLGGDDRLPGEIETVVYRAVQEALTNVLKHAAARSVSIVLERQAGQLRVIIEDDGQGFDPEAMQEVQRTEGSHEVRRGLGLSGLRERLALVGGTMALESAPGSGTTLFLQIPVAAGDRR
jgi:signal transduction histidine kinase